MELDPHVLHVAIRWVHVAAMATAFGGAITVLALSTRPSFDSTGAVVSERGATGVPRVRR